MAGINIGSPTMSFQNMGCFRLFLEPKWRATDFEKKKKEEERIPVHFHPQQQNKRETAGLLPPPSLCFWCFFCCGVALEFLGGGASAPHPPIPSSLARVLRFLGFFFRALLHLCSQVIFLTRGCVFCLLFFF